MKYMRYFVECIRNIERKDLIFCVELEEFVLKMSNKKGGPQWLSFRTCPCTLEFMRIMTFSMGKLYILVYSMSILPNYLILKRLML